MLDPIRINDFRNIVVLTGAGVSVASGLRPFRGPGGLWDEQPGAPPIDARRLEDDPAIVWAFFRELRASVQRAAPNAAHLALAEAQASFTGSSFTLVTQNVDGLHQRAGSTNVVEIHGSIQRDRCTACALTTEGSLSSAVPPCPRCGSPLRPDVVLFDEAIPVAAEWTVKKALRDCDLFLAIGTSGSVTPASNFVRSAEYAGARTVLVNLEPMTIPNPAFQHVVLGRAEELLPKLFV